MKKVFLFTALVTLLLTSFASIKANQNIIISVSKEVVPKHNIAWIYWNTTTEATCNVLYGVKSDLSDGISAKGEIAEKNTDTSSGQQLYVASLYNLVAGLNYYQVICTTADGNSAGKSDIKELKNSDIDTSQLIIDGTRATSVKENLAYVHFGTSNNSNCKVNFSDLAGHENSAAAILEQSANPDNGGYFLYSAMLNNLQASTKYNYTVICNNSNNITKESETYSFYTSMHHEKVVISDVKLIHTSKDVVKITWTTSIETSHNSVSFFNQKSRTGRSYNEDKNVFKKNHEVVISGIEVNDPYEYSVYSALVEGSPIFAKTLYFTVSSDDTAETTVSNIISSTLAELNDPLVNRSIIIATPVQGTKNIKDTKDTNNKIDKDFSNRQAGKILLQVESHGEAWYVNPKNNQRYYMSDGQAAYNIMRSAGIGISNQDLNKIPVATDFIDNLSKLDSDKDGFNDQQELLNGYNPNGIGKLAINKDFANKHKGKIFLQTESHGEAWYISPANGLRYYLGTPASAFDLMRKLGLGITNNDLNKISQTTD